MHTIILYSTYSMYRIILNMAYRQIRSVGCVKPLLQTIGFSNTSNPFMDLLRINVHMSDQEKKVLIPHPSILPMRLLLHVFTMLIKLQHNIIQ